MAYIFDRFFQVEDVSNTGKNKASKNGTGIGLALTYELVKLPEGTITVASEAERGTEFTIYLPFHRDAPKSDISVEESISKAVKEASISSLKKDQLIIRIRRSNHP